MFIFMLPLLSDTSNQLMNVRVKVVQQLHPTLYLLMRGVWGDELQKEICSGIAYLTSC